MDVSHDGMAKRLFEDLSQTASSGQKYVCVGDIAERLGLDFQKVETNRRVLKIHTSGEPSSQLNKEQAELLIARLLWIHPEVSSVIKVELQLTESEVRNAHNLRKWRGSWEDLVNPDAPLVVFEFPNKWLDLEYRNTKRKDVLKDMLLWGLRGNLIEPLPEINDEVLSRRIIPVKLAERGRMLVREAAGREIVGWMAGLCEGGIQVKIFAISEIKGEFNVLHFHLRRPDSEYTKVTPETEEWQYGVIEEWRNSLPKGLIDDLSSGRVAVIGPSRGPQTEAKRQEPKPREEVLEDDDDAPLGDEGDPPPGSRPMCDECGEREATVERYGYMLCSKCLEEELEDDHAPPGEDR
jgi:hypothetical protein